MAREEARARVIEDSETLVNMKVNSNGSINVTSVPVSAPSNATPVVRTAFGAVSSTSGIDDLYTITSGKDLTIQVLQAGAEENTGGSAVDLFHDPNGNLTGMTRLITLYENGDSTSDPIEQTFTGNGTARIVMRRRGFSNNAREMFARWTGYED